MLDVQQLNPEILRWARKTAGLTREEAVRKIGLKDTKKATAKDRLRAMEDGTEEPTRVQLINMAKHYHRSLLVFYLNQPPKSANRGVDFRSLPAYKEDSTNKYLEPLLRDIRVRQSMVRAILEDEDDSEPLHFVGAKQISEGKSAVLLYLQQLLNVSRDQYRSQATPSRAFYLLRRAAEDLGIFVLLKSNLGSHHTNINLEVFRGFVISDEIAPFIVINQRDAVPARSFTLLHELVHLLLGHTGVSGLPGEDEHEKFCNDVASSFLLSKDELNLLKTIDSMDIETIENYVTKFAKDRRLSRTMVTYAAYREGLIDSFTYRKLASKFRAQWLQTQKKKNERAGGANYEVMQRHRLGNNLTELVRRTMKDGSLSTTKAAKILGVKPQHIQSIVQTTS